MKINVNDQNLSVDVPPDTPLLWVLRDELDLKGTKFGCGKGLCGACTVHLNNTAVRSCSIPVSSVGNQKVKTIEGLSKDGSHLLQKAWKKHGVPQCGYCQPGQIMNAAAMLLANPTPSREDIKSGMQGNLCRCGTYARINKALEEVAQTSKNNRE